MASSHYVALSERGILLNVYDILPSIELAVLRYPRNALVFQSFLFRFENRPYDPVFYIQTSHSNWIKEMHWDKSKLELDEKAYVEDAYTYENARPHIPFFDIECLPKNSSFAR